MYVPTLSCVFHDGKRGTAWPLQDRPGLLAVGFVEAARFWAGSRLLPPRLSLHFSQELCRRGSVAQALACAALIFLHPKGAQTEVCATK